MPIRLLQDMECSGKTVVIRQDLNVPMKDGRITNDKRIRAALPGIRMALDKGAGVVLLSHLGRPTEGVVEEKFSLAPVAAHLSGLLGRPVKLAADFDAAKAAPGEVVLLENIRFFKGEKKNDPELAAKLAALGDIYVMDAFGAAHRAHSSTEGAVRAAKVACAGPLMAAELDAFAKVRGMKLAESKMIEAIHQDRAERFKDVPESRLLIETAGTLESEELASAGAGGISLCEGELRQPAVQHRLPLGHEFRCHRHHDGRSAAGRLKYNKAGENRPYFIITE